MQRHNAEQFDPYPSADLGPKMSDGRPNDFVRPRNEVTRARQYRNGEQAYSAPATGPAIPVLPALTLPQGAPPQTYTPPATYPPIYAPTAPATSPMY